VRQVYDVIRRRRPAEYSTTLKFMQIMAAKDLVRRNEKQRAHVYEPAKPREWTQRQLAGDLSAGKASVEELAEMRRPLDEYGKEAK
jgi:BlaI family transcriptional regulator, penicillinase repressor